MAVTFPLRTARLVIEPMGVGDTADFAQYRSEPEVARYQSWDAPYSLVDAERVTSANPSGWPAAGDWLQLAIREDGALLGDVAVHPIDDPAQLDTVEIGVTLAPAAQGRGVATEALTALIAACFAGGVRRIIASTDARNTAVASLLTRVGLRHEGRLVDAEWWKGEWSTIDVWALLATERRLVGSNETVLEKETP